MKQNRKSQHPKLKNQQKNYQILMISKPQRDGALSLISDISLKPSKKFF